MPILAALGAGLIFGFGLALSQMVNPAKVLNFLDLAGTWDPSLAFVLAGASATAGLGYWLIGRLPAPLCAEAFQLPTARAIDGRLVIGSAIFGVGWGLVGLCPGPAVAALSLGSSEVGLFVVAMLAGMAAFQVQSMRERARESAVRTDG